MKPRNFPTRRAQRQHRALAMAERSTKRVDEAAALRRALSSVTAEALQRPKDIRFRIGKRGAK